MVYSIGYGLHIFHVACYNASRVFLYFPLRFDIKNKYMQYIHKYVHAYVASINHAETTTTIEIRVTQLSNALT